MCLGRTHALGGLVAGAAAGMFAAHLLPGDEAMLTVCTAAFATLPDLDQRGSCVSRSFGFLSEMAAWVVNRVSGGHRHGTHTLAGVAVFTAITTVACLFRGYPAGRLTLAAILALAFAAGLRALRLGGHAADLIAVVMAAVVAWRGWGLVAVPFGCFLGTLVHLAGDALTTEGIPFFAPFIRGHIWLLPPGLRFETGHTAERRFVTPVLWVVFGWLAWRAAFAYPVPLPFIHL